MTRRVSGLLITSSLTALFVAGAVHAQTRADQGTTIEELVVTAEKREQSLQDVPVAVSAFTSERRDLIGITSIQDITNFTPGLTYSSGTDRITLRGIGRLTNNLASEPGVANYSDGVYTSSTVEAGRTPLFVDRVEVLRGPQGTLYGRNSIGGAINIISKRPTAEFTGEARATFANYDHQTYQAAVSGPITDGLRFRLAGSKNDQDKGIFHNYSGGPPEGDVRDEYYLEGQLEADLGENVEAWVKYAKSGYQNRATPGGRSGAGYSPSDTALFTPGSLSPSAGFGFTQPGTLVALGSIRGNAVVETGDIRAFSTNMPNKVKLKDNDVLAAEVVWHMPGVDAKYVGGYQRYVYELTSDYDNTAVLSYTIPLRPFATCNFVPGCHAVVEKPNVVSFYSEDKEWWSHELNLSSTNDSPLQWIVGGYYYHEKYHQPVIITEPDQAELATPAAAAPNPERVIYYTDQNMTATSAAAFGQIDWQFTDTLKFTGGLRYTKDKKHGVEYTRQLCFGLPSCLAGLAGLFPAGTALTLDNIGSLAPVLDITGALAAGVRPAGNTDEQKGVAGPAVTDPSTGVRSRGLADNWSAWTGTAGLEWKPSEDLLAYAKYTRGYKAGGFNSGTIQAFPETDSEHVNAYELGAKQNWRTVQANVSAFYYDYTDAQVPVSVQPTTGPLVTLFYNIPKARSIGVELETIWQPIENLQVLFNYAYLDAQIREACCISDAADPNANAPGADPATPPSASGARAQNLKGQHLPLSPRNKVSLNVNYTFDFDPGSLTLSGSYLWRDSVYASTFDRYYYKAPDRDQIDLRVTWKDAKDRYSLIAFGQNVLDEDEYESRTATIRADGSLNRNYTLAPPRTYGVELQYRF